MIYQITDNVTSDEMHISYLSVICLVTELSRYHKSTILVTLYPILKKQLSMLEIKQSY